MSGQITIELLKHAWRPVVEVVILTIAIYYALDVKHTASRTQTTFVGVWLALTLLVVTVGMKRVRSARLRSRAP